MHLDKTQFTNEFANELCSIFSYKDTKTRESYISKISTIFQENPYNQDAFVEELLQFCDGQIEEFLRKSEKKKFGSLYNIRGRKAELLVKEANLRNLGQNPCTNWIEKSKAPGKHAQTVRHQVVRQCNNET